MRPGSRVTVDGHGKGTLIRYMVDRGWVFNRPNVFTWAAVRLDGEQTLRLVNPNHIQEATMNEDPGTGVLIQEPEADIPFVAEDEPATDEDSSSTDAEDSTDEPEDET